LAANQPETGTELWKTDGTEAGTVLVKDIFPGITGSQPKLVANLGGTVLFQATQPETGTELWRTDGTAEGTVLVKDILPGSESGVSANYSNEFIVFDGALYFLANNGYELWKSDGTSAGTVHVTDVCAGNHDFVVSNGTLYFSKGDCAGGGLWKSDGT